ncbi:MAG: site-specific integrase [Acidobacteriota bacterium]
MWQTPQLRSFEVQNLIKTVRDVLRVKHYSVRTEESYVRWILYFLRFHHNQNPLRMGKTETSNFLTHLAVQKRVAVSTQNQALSALGIRELGLAICFSLFKALSIRDQDAIILNRGFLPTLVWLPFFKMSLKTGCASRH